MLSWVGKGREQCEAVIVAEPAGGVFLEGNRAGNIRGVRSDSDERSE